MLFEVTVSNSKSIFSTFEKCQVEAMSGEDASAYVLDHIKKIYTAEKHLFVSHVSLIGDNFIGKARLTKRAPDARKSAPKSRSKTSKGSAKPARG